jgi:integrase
MVLDANGELGRTVALHDKAAKKGSGRSIPIHPQLAEALDAWADQSMHDGHVITSERGGRMTALSIVIWFNRAFAKIGLKGCTSHSSRRTFITRAARLVHKAVFISLTGNSKPIRSWRRTALARCTGTPLRRDAPHTVTGNDRTVSNYYR